MALGARVHGLDYPRLVGRILEGALHRYGMRKAEAQDGRPPAPSRAEIEQAMGNEARH